MASKLKKTWHVTDSIAANAMARDMSDKFGKGWLVRAPILDGRANDTLTYELVVYAADIAGFAPDMTGKTLLAEYVDNELTYSQPPRAPSDTSGNPRYSPHG